MSGGKFTLTQELLARLASDDYADAVEDLRAVAPGSSLEALSLSLEQAGYGEAAANVARRDVDLNPGNIDALRFLGDLLRRRKEWAAAAEVLESLRLLLPGDVVTLNHLSWIYGIHARDLERFRALVRESQRILPEGQYLSCQYGWNLGGLLEGEEKGAFPSRVAMLAASVTPSGAAPEPASPVLAVTGCITEIGADGATVVATVAAMGPAADYRFEIGAGPDALVQATPWRPLPGPLNACSRMAPHNAPLTCRVDAAAARWDGGRGAYMFASPFGLDPNHLTGAGFVSLIYSIRPASCQPDGRQTYESFQAIDLRGARVRMGLRLNGFRAGDFLFGLGLSTANAPWLLSNAPLDLEAAGPDGAAEAEFSLASDPARWSFMGNNPDSDHATAPYAYGPLDRTLAEGTDMVFFVGTHGDWRQAPEGEIGISRMDLHYRSRCVLNPANGALLEQAPDAGGGRLADGRRGGPDDGWQSAGAVTEPLVFRWRLARPVSAATLAVYQHPRLPAKKIRVSLWNSALSDISGAASGVVDLVAIDDPLGEFPLRLLNVESGAQSDMFQLEILEGHLPAGAGLEAVELLARDFVPPPSPTPVEVSEDVMGLPPGRAFHYRVAVRRGGDVAHGEVREFVPPAGKAPLLHAAGVYASAGGRSVIALRANAMGRATRALWRLDGGSWRETDLGRERTPVHRYLTLRGLEAGSTCTLTVKLVSDAGESEERQVTWQAA